MVFRRPALLAFLDRSAPRGLRYIALAGAAGLLVLGAGPALAADVAVPREPLAVAPAVDPDLRIATITLNAQATPRFPGARELTLFGYPSISLRRIDEPVRFTAPDDPLSFSVLETPSLRFGALARFEAGRYFGDDRRRLFGLRDVQFSVEPGAFVEVWPVEWLRARAEVRYGFHGHEGFRGTLGLDGVFRTGAFVFSLGPRLQLGDTSFTSAYFSVTPFEASLNGRVTPFRAQGGVTSVGALGAVTYTWSPQWATTVYAGYDRLVGDAGDSPITRRLGSENQFTVGAKVSYSFAFKPFW